MDFGDLLVFFFIVAGLLSSLVGGKKKKQRLPPAGQRRPPTRPRPPGIEGQGAPPGVPVKSRPPPGGPRPSLDANRPSPFPSQMEEILRQLGLDVGRPAPPEPEPVEPAPEVDAVGRPLPRVVSIESGSLEELEPDVERRHQEFHEEYIHRFSRTRISHYASRAHALLNPQSLRRAVLLHEILGPPKGLQ